MSSNILVNRICEYCNIEFVAKTTVTRFCGDICAKRSYKQRLRDKKLEQSNKQIESIKNQTASTTQIRKIKDVSNLEYLNPTDVSKLLMCSRKNVYSLMNSGRLVYSQLSTKKRLISRKEVDRFLDDNKPIGRKPVDRIEKEFDLNYSLSIQEIQERYGISEKALYEIIKKHNVRKYKTGKYVFVENRDLIKIFGR